MLNLKGQLSIKTLTSVHTSNSYITWVEEPYSIYVDQAQWHGQHKLNMAHNYLCFQLICIDTVWAICLLLWAIRKASQSQANHCIGLFMHFCLYQ